MSGKERCMEKVRPTGYYFVPLYTIIYFMACFINHVKVPFNRNVCSYKFC